MHSKKEQPVLIDARTIAVGAVGDLAYLWVRPSDKTDLSQKNVLQKVHRIFDLLEVECSEISLVDLTRALGYVFRGKNDSTERNVLRVVNRVFEVIEMEFLEDETEVWVKATGCVFCGLDVCLSYIDGGTDFGNRWTPPNSETEPTEEDQV